jgi:broad specificity phosphatase PhoE
MPIKTIYFVRHGQSDDNIAPVFQSLDSPLNSVGIKQAHEVAKRIAKLDPDVLISSPLRRAMETATIISDEIGKAIKISDLFVERGKPKGILGIPYSDITANQLWRKWEKSLYTPGMRVDDGENFEDLIKRADAVLDYLDKRSESSIVVVSHGYFLRTLIARVLLKESLTSESFYNFLKVSKMENTAITTIAFEEIFEEKPLWRLDSYSDYSHLK